MAGQNIPDGYTLDSTITIKDRPELTLTIKYRPMLGPLRNLLMDQQTQSLQAPVANRLKAIREAAQVVAQALSEQIVSWDVRDAEGKVRDITAESLLLLNPEQFTAIENRIEGWYRPEETGTAPAGESTEESTEKN